LSVVVTVRSVYSPAVPASSAARVFRILDRGPAGRLVLRADAEDRGYYLVIARYEGPDLPALLTNPVIEAVDGTGQSQPAWRLTSVEGRFEFRAQAVDRLEERPALYEPLHQPFVLRGVDRAAVRVLLWLLRLPGGARLLRSWHARRR
jgi:hypothetical protein